MTDNPGKSKIAGIRVRRREPARVEEIPLARIQPSPLNPRRSMDEAELDDLAASMRAHGQLQPALVRPHPDGSPDGDALYEMVCGHRRRAAAERGGLPRLLCTIREMTDAQAVEAMLAENSKRADVAPLDESAALSRLVEWGESPADLADRLGRTSKWVRDRLALARLVDELRALLDQGAIGIGSAVVLAQIGADEQRAIANVIPRMWSTTTTDIRREVERRARNLAGAPWSLEAALADRQSCSNCSTRTDVQADLFAQDSGARCLDRSCWKAKGLAWADEQRAAGADVREEQVDYGGTLKLTDPVWWLPEELRQTPARELVPDVAPIIYIADGAVTVRLPHERVTQALAEHDDPEVAGAARERLERLRDYGALHGRPIEVRSKPCPALAIGRRIWLHCAKASKRTERADAELLAEAGFDVTPARAWRGHIVARARVVASVEIWGDASGTCHPAAWKVTRSSGLQPGWARPAAPWVLPDRLPARFAPKGAHLWLLGEVEQLDPIAARGQLGLWRVAQADHREALRRAQAARCEAALQAIEAIGEEIGPVRRRATSYIAGREPGLVVQADPVRMHVEATRGPCLHRRPGIRSAAGFAPALREAVAAVRGVRKDLATPGHSSRVGP